MLSLSALYGTSHDWGARRIATLAQEEQGRREEAEGCASEQRRKRCGIYRLQARAIRERTEMGR